MGCDQSCTNEKGRGPASPTRAAREAAGKAFSWPAMQAAWGKREETVQECQAEMQGQGRNPRTHGKNGGPQGLVQADRRGMAVQKQQAEMIWDSLWNELLCSSGT